jgi:hypothetical protein
MIASRLVDQTRRVKALDLVPHLLRRLVAAGHVE